jgi:hypothetical protein
MASTLQPSLELTEHRGVASVVRLHVCFIGAISKRFYSFIHSFNS